MTATTLDLFFGWAALLSAAATLGTFVTAILFFAVNPAFGRINDAVSVVQMLLMLPVAVTMALLTHADYAWLAWMVAVVGSTGMIVVAMLQALLVLGRVRFEQTIGAVLAAGALIGLWLIAANALALAGGLPWGLGAFGIAAGIGYLLSAAGFFWGGQRHPLQKVLAEFRRYFGEICVDLDQARETDGEQFVDAMLAAEPNRLGKEFRQVLFQRTRGHPLFTIELLRDMQERGVLVQDEQGCWLEGSLLD
jgi:hypothetical protein